MRLSIRSVRKEQQSLEKAMTIQKLGLPPRFEDAVHRRLGQTGIFVEVNGRYYLNEERLKQIQEQRAKGRYAGGGGSPSRTGPPTWTRVAGILLMLPIGIIVAVVLFYFFAYNGGLFPSEFLIILLVIMLALFAVRLLFWRSRTNIGATSGRAREVEEQKELLADATGSFLLLFLVIVAYLFSHVAVFENESAFITAVEAFPS